MADKLLTPSYAKVQLKFVKCYAKALKRRALNVYTVQEAQNLVKKQNDDALKNNTPEKKTLAANRKSTCQLEDGTNITYEHLRNEDERFGHAMNELKSQHGRSQILLEGIRLITEAINQKVKIKSLFLTDQKMLKQLPCNRIINLPDCKFYKVSEKQMKLWSETKGPSGSIAIAKQPKRFDSPVPSLAPVTLLIDGLNDEGQVGTLIRSAVAASVQRILITQGSVDPWSPKVLRAGMGAHFHHPINTSPWENIHTYINNDVYNVDNTRNNKLKPTKSHLYVLNTFTNDIMNELTSNYTCAESLDDHECIKYEQNSFIIISGEKPTKGLVNLLDMYKANNSNNNNDNNDDDGDNSKISENDKVIKFIRFPDRNGVKMTQAVSGSVLLYEVMHQFLR